MRFVLATALVLFGGGTALAASISPASSINTIGSPSPVTVSIVDIHCATCKSTKARETNTYTVPELASGTQKTTIVDINGKKNAVRVEAWFGGSPVVHVTTLPLVLGQEKAIGSVHPKAAGSTQAELAAIVAPDDGIDRHAMTSAVNADVNIDAPAKSTEPLKLAEFELRLEDRPENR